MSNSPLSPQAAARELIRRRKARRTSADYARSIDIPGAPVGDEESDEFGVAETPIAPHHELILSACDEAASRRHGRVMIFAPPGSAKSTYASVVFPSRYLGQQPERRLILASYGDDLARKMGRRTRAVVRQPQFRSIFDTGLTKDSAAVQQFSLENGSEYMAVGILSGVTGNRAHGLIIDDPVKGREQANSETIRKKTWDAYNDDLKTRLMPGGWVVLIQTRWHQSDLAGLILPEDWSGQSGDILCRDGMVWHVICLQARCETDTDPLGRTRGQYLWPEWFDEDHWKQFEAQPITWPSLFQQVPAPPDGGIFKPAQLELIDALPAGNIKWVRGWDFASVSKGGDFTVGAKLGRLPDGRLLIGDIERGQYGPDERDSTLVNTSARDGSGVRISIPQDPGQAGKTQIVYLTRKLSGHRVHSSPETGDKVSRAELLAAQVNVGNVLMLRGSWNEALVDEMRMFPNGTHDDQIDALSRAFSELIGRPSSFFS